MLPAWAALLACLAHLSAMTMHDRTTTLSQLACPKNIFGLTGHSEPCKLGAELGWWLRRRLLEARQGGEQPGSAIAALTGQLTGRMRAHLCLWNGDCSQLSSESA